MGKALDVEDVPRIRWLNDAESDLRKAGIRRWRQKAEDMEEWHSHLNVVPDPTVGL